jgi:DNA-directed RNA polymerase specialized sigma24 family protein
MIGARTLEQIASGTSRRLSDEEILLLFQSDPERAWRSFIDRYADAVYTELRRMGFDYDQAMDRFVFVFEKLAENDYRRLKTVRFAGRNGELTPWLSKVVRNLCVNWAWSEHGRRRLLKPIATMPRRDQRVFELYFWKGLSPALIHEQLRLEHERIALVDVLDALERIFECLSQTKLWRLLSNLARHRAAVSLDESDEGTGLTLDPADTRSDPERSLLEREAVERLDSALADLRPRERLVVQFRYEEGMALTEIAEMLNINRRTVARMLEEVLEKLRQSAA